MNATNECIDQTNSTECICGNIREIYTLGVGKFKIELLVCSEPRCWRYKYDRNVVREAFSHLEIPAR